MPPPEGRSNVARAAPHNWSCERTRPPRGAPLAISGLPTQTRPRRARRARAARARATPPRRPSDPVRREDDLVADVRQHVVPPVGRAEALEASRAALLLWVQHALAWGAGEADSVERCSAPLARPSSAVGVPHARC